jgi:hypothetical protein
MPRSSTPREADSAVNAHDTFGHGKLSLLITYILCVGVGGGREVMWKWNDAEAWVR